MMAFIMHKLRDEGTAEPHVARLWLGIFTLRDQALPLNEVDRDAARKAFDAKYRPVLEAIDALMSAEKKIQRLLTQHRKKVESGDAISFQRNAVSITDSIDVPLREAVSTFLNAGTRTLKYMQPFMDRFGVSIGCLFQNERDFRGGLKTLSDAGHAQVAEYLAKVRQSWSQDFMQKRNSLEHQGWSPPQIDYRFAGPQATMIEPLVDDLPLSEYVRKTLGRVLAFVEELAAHGCATRLPAPTALTEVLQTDRDPLKPLRFVPALANSGQPTWTLRYEDTGFYQK